MGVYINLVVNFDAIDDKKWEETYKESVKMLQEFPVPLIRREIEKINGRERLVATEDLVADKGLETEHWDICGDWTTEQEAENFLLYRYPKSTSGYDDRPKSKAKNILWAPKDLIDDPHAEGVEVFGNKTQGELFHLGVLAAGILFENRFPDSIFVTGDIDREQAEVLLPWMNNVLQEPVKLPIVTDGERLYKKLQKLYDEPDLAIQRFEALYTEGRGEAEGVLFKYAPKEYVLQRFVESLSDRISIKVADSLISKFLTATEDVKQLIELVLQVGKDSNGFELEELLRLLVARFITIPKEAKEPIRLFVYSENPLEHMESIFARNLSRLGDPPQRIDFYIDSADLLKTFVTYMPSKEGLFQAILQEEEQKCYQTIERIQKIVMESEEESSSKQQGAKRSTYPPLEAYIRARIWIQVRAKMQRKEEDQKGEKLAKKHLRSLADDIKKAIDELPEVARDNSLQFYREAIYEGSVENYIVLSKSQWDSIDNCTDKTILKLFMVLANNPSRLRTFVELREYLFRNPTTWPQLAEIAGAV